METKGFFQFESIFNDLLISFILIPVLWVDGYYDCLFVYYRRQILTSKVDPRAERINDECEIVIVFVNVHGQYLQK